MSRPDDTPPIAMSEIEDIRKELGLVQIYTGNGKGKSIASFGLAVRAKMVCVTSNGVAIA